MGEPAVEPKVDIVEDVVPETVTIPKEEWETVKESLKKLDKFDQRLDGMVTPAPVAVAPIPSGPTVIEQVTEIDEQLSGLDTQLAEAVTSSDGNKVVEISRKRDELNEKRTTIRITAEQIDPIRQHGYAAMGNLSDQVLSGQMPHLALPAVKATYDQTISGLTPDQRANPQVLVKAYEMATGLHVQEIVTSEIEKAQRKANDVPVNIPGAAGDGRTQNIDSNTIPPPKDVLPPESLALLKRSKKTVDGFYQAMGYKSWDDYYGQHESDLKGGE